MLCAAALVCIFVHERVGAGAIAIVNLAALIGPLYSHNGTLLFWVAMTLATFRHPAQRRTVLRAQLSILYGAAALAKFNTEWLSGRVLKDVGALVPMPGAAAVVTVLVELFLAVALWSPKLRWPVPAVALAIHVVFVALLPGPWSWIIGLIVFNVLAVVLVWWTRAPACCQWHTRGRGRAIRRDEAGSCRITRASIHYSLHHGWAPHGRPPGAEGIGGRRGNRLADGGFAGLDDP